jgi:hypothetical protein
VFLVLVAALLAALLNELTAYLLETSSVADRRPSRRRAGPSRRGRRPHGLLTLGAFGACLVALVVLGLLARVRPARVSDPETLFARLMARRATRVAMTLAWAWIGWHFLVTPPS